MEKPGIRGKLDELNRKLYQKDTPAVFDRRAEFTREESKIPNNWEQKLTGRRSLSILGMFFIASAIFFVVALIVASYSFSSGRNVVSPDNIDIAITGPVAVKAGEELRLQITVTNNNSIPLDASDLILLYPAQSRDPERLDREMGRSPKFLGIIKPGQTVNVTSRAVVFGKEGDEREIPILLEYRAAGSNAIFEKRSQYRFVISSAPVHVGLSLPPKITSGQEIPIEVTISSNAGQEVSGLLLTVEYPTGFQFKRAEPPASEQNRIWKNITLSAGTSRTIKIFGVIKGDRDERKGFGAVVGLPSADNPKIVGVPYANAVESTAIESPLIALNFSLGGDQSEVVMSKPGDDIRADILIRNGMNEVIRDGEITVTIDGPAVDYRRVLASGGVYRLTEKSILWRQQDKKDLAEIVPGGELSVNFDLESLENQQLIDAGISNPTIEFVATFKGKRITSEFASEDVSVVVRRSVRLKTTVLGSSATVYSVGPFTNTGPIPPKVDQETTYTVYWRLNNTINDVKDGVVTATLPTYVKYLNQVSPAEERVEYNQANGQVSWYVGNVQASSGFRRPIREVAFRVSVTPSLNQVGVSPVVVSEGNFSGRDAFTNLLLSETISAVTTRLSGDPVSTGTSGAVVE